MGLLLTPLFESLSDLMYLLLQVNYHELFGQVAELWVALNHVGNYRKTIQKTIPKTMQETM